MVAKKNGINISQYLKTIYRYPIICNVMIFLLFLYFASASNYSLLVGHNLMKWDMWDLEYPNQVLMSDALAAKTLPLWNPLMQYGSPWFAAIGTPVWYPITMLFALIGYTPQILSWVYILHVALGGFGMYLLAKLNLKKHNDKDSISCIIASVLIGLLYCGNGVFLSNAQHMMIIISAAWIPYVFYYVRMYLIYSEKYYALLGGLFAGLIVIGGYPEIFYNMFIYLAFYTLYFVYSNNKTVYRNIKDALKKYLLIVVCTISAGLITILPLICNMSNLARANSSGQIPNGYTFATLLSLFISQISCFVPDVECSMVNYYTRLLAVILLPAALINKNPHKWIYIFLSGVAFLLCWPKQIFLHSVLYKFLPMYDTFRFPTLNRIFLSIFVLLLVSNVIKDVLDNKNSKFTLVTNFMLVFLGIVALGIVKTRSFVEQIFSEEQLKALEVSICITVVFYILYLLCQLIMLCKKKIGMLGKIVLCILIPVEVCMFCYQETGITIALFKPEEYSQNEQIGDYITGINSLSENRNRSVNFAGNTRGTNQLNSNAIVNNKIFDEDGYVCFKQSKTELYKQTYNRSIIETNPVVYFTNNVVSEEEIEYEQWVNSCATPPEQIYVEVDNGENAVPEVPLEKTKTLLEEELVTTFVDGVYHIGGNLSACDECTGRIRLFLEEENNTTAHVQVTFVSGDKAQTYVGDYRIERDESSNYVDIFFPSVGMMYDSVMLQITDETVIESRLVVTERLIEDKYVTVSNWGFNEINMNVTAPTEGYVTLLQAYHAGWNVYVDGKETDVVLVDDCFMGVFVPVGEHTIDMKFIPIDFWLGFCISVGYVLLCIVVFFRRTGRNKTEDTYYNKRLVET